MKFADALAVVTGGASGLGLGVARHVVSHGGKVVILDVQEGPGNSAAASLGERATFVRCDVTSEAEVNSSTLVFELEPVFCAKTPFNWVSWVRSLETIENPSNRWANWSMRTTLLGISHMA